MKASKLYLKLSEKYSILLAILREWLDYENCHVIVIYILLLVSSPLFSLPVFLHRNFNLSTITN